MIQKECFEKEWIDKVCSSHKFKHPELVEKVIRAFSLLEMLVKEGCPLTFKGGTSSNICRTAINTDLLIAKSSVVRTETAIYQRPLQIIL